MRTEKFNLNDYDDRYFNWHYTNTKEYIIKTMKWYVSTYNPDSVIDFGCGVGFYLKTAFDNNINNLKGFDIGGEYAKKFTPEEVQGFIEYCDCTEPIKLTLKYDCVISIETAEHIEPLKTETFISNIVNAVSKTGTILFSAAKPGQNGTGHINLHEREFWIKKFKDHYLNYNDVLTKKISDNWRVLGAPNYVYENLIVFKKNNI